MADGPTRRQFLRATVGAAAIPAALGGCTVPRIWRDSTPTPVACEPPVDPSLGVSVQFEQRVYGVPVCGVACEVTRRGASGVDLAVLRAEGDGSCGPVTARGAPLKAQEAHGKTFDVSSSRRKVMRAKGQPAPWKSMHGDAVSYDDGFYPTERAYLIPYIVGTRAAFERQRRLFDTTQDQHCHTNELLVLWDAQAGGIAGCLLDGEPIAVELAEGED